MVMIILHNFFYIAAKMTKVSNLLHPTNRECKKYTHDKFQNKLLRIMAKHVLNEKLSNTRESPFFALIAGEYIDISSGFQCAFVG